MYIIRLVLRHWAFFLFFFKRHHLVICTKCLLEIFNFQNFFFFKTFMIISLKSRSLSTKFCGIDRCMVVFSTHGLTTRRSSPRIVHRNLGATAWMNHRYVASPGRDWCLRMDRQSDHPRGGSEGASSG